MTMTSEKWAILKTRIAEHYDPDEVLVLDILGLTSEELIDQLEELVFAKLDVFDVEE